MATSLIAMLGAIIGDIAGSEYEFRNCKRTDIDLFPSGCDFTDDSILTVATCEVLLRGGDYAEAYQRYGRRYPSPKGAYGTRFARWIWEEPPQPYNSWGNGSAMRVAPVGLAFDTADAVLAEAARSAGVSHNHPEGIKGAQATALAVFMARTGSGKDEIREQLARRFGYDLDRTVEGIRPAYGFDESCQGTVPQAIIAFLDSSDYESAIRNAISLGGDSDTLACITGGIAHAFYRIIPDDFIAKARQFLPKKLMEVVDEFQVKHPLAGLAA